MIFQTFLTELSEGEIFEWICVIFWIFIGFLNIFRTLDIEKSEDCREVDHRWED
jgi:hypothetical protein